MATNENPQSCSSGGFLVRYGEPLRLGCCYLFIPVQPFAYVVANYTCYNRDKKSENKICHVAFTSFLLEVRQLLHHIISHASILQNSCCNVITQKGSVFYMPLSKGSYTSKDYWNLPDGKRAELINGIFYDIAMPDRIHQQLVAELSFTVQNHLLKIHSPSEVYLAPFAVNIDANDKDWVEPDISVICNPDKLTDRGCSGAPDLIFEIVSPSSRRMDYNIKNGIYAQAGVREYWIVDPVKERVTTYHYEVDAAPVIHTFDQDIPIGIYDSLSIRINDLL